MKHLNYLVLLSALALLSPLHALARDKDQHSVNIPESVQIGSTTLTPGSYKVEWQGAGPAVQVEFLRYGKTVATAPATLKTNDKEVIQDDVVTDANDAKTKTLMEIDLAHQKEALSLPRAGCNHFVPLHARTGIYSLEASNGVQAAN